MVRDVPSHDQVLPVSPNCIRQQLFHSNDDQPFQSFKSPMVIQQHFANRNYCQTHFTIHIPTTQRDMSVEFELTAVEKSEL
jgi:hypothetical protein